VGIPKEKIDTILILFLNNIDNKRKFGGLGLACFVKTLVDARRNNKMESVCG
jgi:hypothetical protein